METRQLCQRESLTVIKRQSVVVQRLGFLRVLEFSPNKKGPQLGPLFQFFFPLSLTSQLMAGADERPNQC